MVRLGIFRNIMIGGIVAALVNVGIFYLARNVVEVDFWFYTIDGYVYREIGWINVAVSSLVPAPLAALVYYLLFLFARRNAENVFLIISGLLLALSFVPMLGEMPVEKKISLGLMHVITVVLITWFAIERPLMKKKELS